MRTTVPTVAASATDSAAGVWISSTPTTSRSVTIGYIVRCAPSRGWLTTQASIRQSRRAASSSSRGNAAISVHGGSAEAAAASGPMRARVIQCSAPNSPTRR